MVYDHQPWHDHFRVLHDGKDGQPRMILGVWCSRGCPAGWFTLEAYPELDEATAHVHAICNRD